MTDYKKEAQALEAELIANRRTIHSYAETGFALPQTVAFVMDQLRSYGLTPQKVGKAGVTALVGKPSGKVFLLRADMDALPMAESSGEPFAAQNGNCHSCGHDCHAAMLLGAAKLLKAHESELNGQVKFMFQPAEELLAGAVDMLENGILENPPVTAGLGLHVSVGGGPESEPGVISYRTGTASYSGDCIRITIQGQQAHGSTTHLGVDAIHIAAHIVLALEAIQARETPMDSRNVVLVGTIQGGSSCNTMSGTCTMEVSVRSDTREGRAFLLQRVEEISKSTAAAFRGEAQVEHVYGMPGLYCDPTISEQAAAACRSLLGPDQVLKMTDMSGTEDFTSVAERIPAAFLNLGAGSAAGGHTCGMHNPSMTVEETALPVGTAVYCQCATQYLNKE